MINYTVAEWEAEGVALGARERAARSLMWDIGDWWNRGERYGERVTIVTAAGWTGPRHQTCRDAGWVANRWPVSLRQDRLTFEHHKSVAALADDEAMPLLLWAAEDPADRPASELRTRAKQVRRDIREVELGAEQRALSAANFTYGWDRLPPEDALLVGKAAEHLVCADLLMRGYNAFQAAQGSTYDVVVEVGAKLFRVQVKSTQRVRDVNADGREQRIAYNFSVRRRGRDGQKRLSEEDADIVACVAMDIPAIAYFPVYDCPATIQLEPGPLKPGGYVRAYDRPITEYPFIEALEKTQAVEAYIDLQKVFPPFPRRRYGVIMADCPWSFEPYSRDSGLDRAADNHYPTVSTDTLRGIGPYIPASRDCVLFLWATVPMLPDALALMQAWSFDYKSHFVWVKDSIGTGYWNRNQHELLLVGTRGAIPAPAHGQQYASVFHVSAGEHSAKPDAVAEMIEELFPNLPAIELFARRARLGWDVWGNEVPSEPLSIAAD